MHIYEEHDMEVNNYTHVYAHEIPEELTDWTTVYYNI